MSERIPQSATIRVPLQAYLASDHISAATGKTIAITISKNGAAYGNPSGGATNAVEIANGSYYVDLSTTDTGTVGPLFVRGAVATVDDVIAIYHVVKATNGGFTALPDAAAEAAGGLYTRGTGAGQINQPANGQIDANAVKFAGQTITAATGVTIPESIASPTNITAGTITTVTNVTNAPTAGDLTATMKTSIGTAVAASAVASVTGNVGGNVAGSVGSVTAGVTVTTNNDKTGYALSSAGITSIWAEVMTGSVTAVQAMRGFLAALLGKASGLETTTPAFRNVADTKDVIVATVDADGNRSAVTLDLT